MSFDRANHYVFDENSIRWYAKPVGSVDNRLIMEFSFLVTGVTSLKKIWDVLRDGEEILLSPAQLDEFEACIRTLPDSEQDLYLSDFRSFRTESLNCGTKTKGIICSLKPIKEALLT